jgi:hypothetical protein
MGHLCYDVQLMLHRFAWAGFPSVKNTIQQAVSKISREKIDGSRQMTIFDFGFTRSQ